MPDTYVPVLPGVIELPGLFAVEIHTSTGRHWITLDWPTSRSEAARDLAFVFDGTDRHLIGTRRGRMQPGEVGLDIERVIQPKKNFVNWLEGRPEEGDDDGP